MGRGDHVEKPPGSLGPMSSKPRCRHFFIECICGDLPGPFSGAVVSHLVDLEELFSSLGIPWWLRQ